MEKAGPTQLSGLAPSSPVPTNAGLLIWFSVSCSLLLLLLFELHHFLTYKTKTWFECVCVLKGLTYLFYLASIFLSLSTHTHTQTNFMFLLHFSACVSLTDPSAPPLPPPFLCHTHFVPMATGITTEQRWLCQMHVRFDHYGKKKKKEVWGCGCHGYGYTTPVETVWVWLPWIRAYTEKPYNV